MKSTNFSHTHMISYPLYLNLEDALRLASRKLSANPGLTGEVISTRRMLYLPDLSQPEVQQAHKIVVIVDMGVKAYLGIGWPLKFCGVEWACR